MKKIDVWEFENHQKTKGIYYNKLGVALLFTDEGMVQWGQTVKGIRCLDPGSREYVLHELDAHPRTAFKGPYRVGMFVRSKICGKIGVIVHVPTCVWFPDPNVGHTHHSPFKGEPGELMELALPRKGEWWIHRGCQVHHMPPSGPIHMDSDWSESFVDAQVACGCFIPINFGSGEEKKKTDRELFIEDALSEMAIGDIIEKWGKKLLLEKRGA